MRSKNIYFNLHSVDIFLGKVITFILEKLSLPYLYEYPYFSKIVLDYLVNQHITSLHTQIQENAFGNLLIILSDKTYSIEHTGLL